VHPRFANVPPYDYHSTSRSYRAGERFAENYGEYDGTTRNYGKYGHRSHHRYSREGLSDWRYSEGYGEEAPGYAQNRYSEEPNAEGPDDYYSGNAGIAMSINSPAALDPWHGYDADCPDAYDGE
jgi:hypothetical protein